MIRKELLKELMVTFQSSLPVELINRKVDLASGTGKIVSVSGVRRSGKSAALMLAMNKLLVDGVKKEYILFLNFDDERLQFEKNEFDLILQSYQELYPDIQLKDVYVFFDEIQMNDGWEQFVRRVYDQHTKHIFITGSNSKMLSSEIATSLRGRTLQYEIFPLSFAEYCRFRNLETDVYITSVRAKIISAFYDFLQFGGFPEVALMNHEHFEQILQEYYFVMLYKDLVERYEIKNVAAVKYFIRRLLSNITKPTSVNKIYNELKSQGVLVGKNTLYELVEYLEAIYLFMPLFKFEPSLVKQNSSDKKYYVIDNGFRRALLQTVNDDNGILLENMVYLWLRSSCDKNMGIYYFKGKKECDFVITSGTKVTKLIQVCWDISETATLKREMAGLLEASEQLNCAELTLITADREDTLEHSGKVIHVVPAWKIMVCT
ncbi:MAG: ATP-binding protein [Lentimicrobium sp.]|nr:ATP-binding protein [Lentimicrobium sp.]